MLINLQRIFITECHPIMNSVSYSSQIGFSNFCAGK